MDELNAGGLKKIKVKNEEEEETDHAKPSPLCWRWRYRDLDKKVMSVECQIDVFSTAVMKPVKHILQL